MQAASAFRVLLAGTLAVGLALPALAVQQASGRKQTIVRSGVKDPVELLLQSMRGDFAVNVRTVLVQRDPKAPATFIRVHIERAKDGPTRQTITQPLRMAGVTSVDDGVRIRMFLPDRREIIDQASPLLESQQAEHRIALARKNYTFTASSGGKIAGRDAIMVSAVPRHAGMETRRYFLDRDTAYPLRLEVVSGGRSQLVFDTKDIEFPARMDEKLFRLQPVGDVKILKYNRPQRIDTPAQAKKLVGFVPIVPTNLPMGFQVQEVQVNEDDKWKAVMVRISDGLARATVHQWRAADNARVETPENSTVLDVNGVRLMIAADLPGPIRERLLQAFAAQLSDLSPDQRMQKMIGFLSPVELGLVSSLELVNALSALSGLEGLSTIDILVVGNATVVP
jgi:hypothetical protein